MKEALIANLLSTALLAIVGVGPSPAQIVINEFLPAPDGAQEEFIELLNAGDTAVRLAEVTFRDGRSGWISVATDSPLLLSPGELLVLSDALQPAWPGTALLHPAGWASLNNSGDSIAVAVRGAVTDRAGYQVNERGRSLERIDPDIPGHLRSNWATSWDPSGGTPGRLNSRHRPDTTAPYMRGAEFDPPRSLILWLSEPVDPASLAIARIDSDGFFLDPAGTDPTGERLDLTLPDDRTLRTVSVAGLFDYAGHHMRDTTLSIALPAAPGDVRLSEMLIESGTGPGALPEFIELAATSAGPVSLRGSHLEIGSGPEPDLIPMSAPDDTRIMQSNGAFVVFASPESGPTAEHVRELVETAIDRHVPSDAPARRRVDTQAANPGRLALRNSGDLVRLVSSEGVELDAVLYDADWNDSRFSDHRQRSIRRIRTDDPDLPTWSSTLHESGTTPGLAETTLPSGFRPAFGDLAFSELMPRPRADPHDGRPDQMEYVELANVSGRAVDLNGLILAGPPADDGTTTGRRLVYQPLTLQPGAVAVVYELPSSAPDDAVLQLDRLADAFPEAYPGGIGLLQMEASLGRDGILTGVSGILIPVRGAISLNDDGESLRLLAANGAMIDSIAYSPAMHHPSVVDPTGRALERTVLSPAPLELGGWSTSTLPGGGSPGLLPRGPGPPPSPPSAGASARLAPRTISPDGDGIDDLTVIRVDNLDPGSVVRVDIFDLDGRAVRTLTPGTLTGGSFAAEWSGLDDVRRPVARGFYVVLVRITGKGGDRGAYRLPVAVAR